jgi:hypothetical protein
MGFECWPSINCRLLLSPPPCSATSSIEFGVGLVGRRVSYPPMVCTAPFQVVLLEQMISDVAVLLFTMLGIEADTADAN